MDVVRVDNKGATDSVPAELGHTVKVNQQREEDVVGGGAIFQYPE